MQPKFDYGEEVRVIRNIRNDGTYPNQPTGCLLISRGSVGYVRDVGTFLQDQLIYSVDFIDMQKVVGCREQELQLASEPWVPTQFDFRDKVFPKLSLAINGEVVATPETEGEVEKVFANPEGVYYYVRFAGKTLQVPETALITRE